jgi:hypothetical protein
MILELSPQTLFLFAHKSLAGGQRGEVAAYHITTTFRMIRAFVIEQIACLFNSENSSFQCIETAVKKDRILACQTTRFQ